MKTHEILFRGRRPICKEWVEGFLGKDTIIGEETYTTYVIHKNDLRLFSPGWWIVEEETVGMYTTLPDRNGRKIFEGDICRFYSDKEYSDYEVFFTNNASDCQAVGFYVRQLDSGATDTFNAFFASNCEVIGNIHDNSELVQRKE